MRTPAQLLTPIVVGVAVLALTGALTGCSAIADAVHKEHEESFDSYTAARQGWSGQSIPAWIPDDATDIRSLATDDYSNVMVRVVTGSALPADCTSSDRLQLPYTTRDWAPDAGRLPDTVEHCGDWEVTPTSDGFYAWYHAAAIGDMPAG